uniref:Uncharacterized protein n=1 Tax=Romanomermis culicivorax TaxID=13658 RepID=A0A915I345_ROMCU
MVSASGKDFAINRAMYVLSKEDENAKITTMMPKKLVTIGRRKNANHPRLTKVKRHWNEPKR